MSGINILKFDVKTKVIEGKTFIYDFLRKKFIVMTPEELVRQKLLRFLIEEKKYPKSLCKVESGVKLGELNKRTDILFYNKQSQPYLLIECKSFKVDLTQKTFDQLSVYNQTIKAKYIGISNGLEHQFCEIDYSNKKIIFLNSVPEYVDR